MEAVTWPGAAEEEEAEGVAGVVPAAKAACLRSVSV